MMTRCECSQLSFVALLSYARRHGISTLAELSRATGAGTRCGNCRPYLEELLRSGKLRVGDHLMDLPGVTSPGTTQPSPTDPPDQPPSASPTPPPS